MAFVKLDCGMLDSTLWIERDCREIFITALLMAEPREFLEPIPQIATGSCDATGWIAPAGWYGFVEASGPGIVRRAMVEHTLGMEALTKLGAPDPESRSADFEGRRMIRVDGGFLILNFIRYREKDSTSAERSKRWRERQKEKDSQQATRVTDTSQRVIRHQAEVEAEVDSITTVVNGCSMAPATEPQRRVINSNSTPRPAAQSLANAERVKAENAAARAAAVPPPAEVMAKVRHHG